MTRAARRPLRLLALAPLVGLALSLPVAPAVADQAPSPSATPQSSSSSSAGATAPKATFGIGPANTKGIDGRPYLNYLASPGARLVDRVGIINLATKPVTLNLYVVDATVDADGAFGYLPKASPRTDAATWIVTDNQGHQPTVTLPPRSTLVVPVTITVPSDASPGDHAAGIITSVVSKVTSASGTNANLEQRVALRTFIRVSGPLHPALAIENLRARYHGTFDPIGGGSVTMSYTVRNTGNVRIGSHQQVAVSGLFGSKTKTLADVPLLLPHTFVNVSVTIHGVFPSFLLHARVSLHPLSVVGDVDPGMPSQIVRSVGVWAIPWVLLGIIAVIVLAGVGLWQWRRTRGWRPPASHQFGRSKKGPSGPSGSGVSPASQPSQPEGART
jgi:hypothetical protein